jgi:hypothetical protein
MFISYGPSYYLGKEDGKYIWKYELIDSEFGTVSSKMFAHWVPNIGTAVIQEYSKRNLNVAANLALSFVWYNKLHPYWSIQQLIDHNKRRNPLFPQYEQDIQKYLVLL